MNPYRLGTRVTALAVVCSFATGQVRLDLHNDMQIQGYRPIDGRTGGWPLKANGMAVGDVDGDGDLDVIVAGHDDGWLWRNAGDGTFPTAERAPTSGSTSVALFDADGDGDLDLATGGGSRSYPVPRPHAVWLNDGSGTFTLAPNLPVQGPNLPIASGGVAVRDFDGDNDIDIVFLTDQGRVYWRNDGGGAFSDQTSSMPPVAAAATAGFLPDASVDVDNDGLVDRLGLNFDGTPFLRRNVGGGVLQNVERQWFDDEAFAQRTNTFGNWYYTGVVFDADGDGRPDLLRGGCEGRNTASTTIGIPPKLWLNTGTSFVDSGRTALPMTQDGGTSIASGDFDHNGTVDLAIATRGSSGAFFGGELRIFLQDTGGRFQSGAVLAGVVVCTADFDGDGDLDLFSMVGGPIWAPGLPAPYLLYVNDGSGSFTNVAAQRLPATAFSGGASCAAGDIDGDGDVDLVVGSLDTTTSSAGVPLKLFLNDGQGFFTDASNQLPGTTQASALLLRDFDRDGDLDVVVIADQYHTAPALALANDGSGHFTDVTAARLPQVTTDNASVQAFDVDRDGDLDLVGTRAQTSPGATMLVNDGGGSFALAPWPGYTLPLVDLDENGIPETSFGPMPYEDQGEVRFFALDLDDDGDQDLVISPIFPSSCGSCVDQVTLRTELLYNQRRDLRLGSLPRLGKSYRVRLRAGDASGPVTAITGLSPTVPQPPLSLGSLGDLRLHPAAVLLLPFAVVPDPDTTVELAIALPSSPQFLGMPLTAQSLFVPTNPARAHLSNAVSFAIEN